MFLIIVLVSGKGEDFFCVVIDGLPIVFGFIVFSIVCCCYECMYCIVEMFCALVLG